MNAMNQPSSTTTPTDPARTAMTDRERLAVGLLLVSTFVVILNETLMGVALPRLMSDLAITAGTAQWVTTAFMLTMAVVIPVTGFVLQRLTTRTAFGLAMGLFCTGTLICALSPGLVVLLVGRVVQASGTAVMLPLLMTTVMTVTPPASRGRTMGNISVVISVAPALGPTVSGLVLSVLDWRWLFGLVLPIAVGALVLGALRLPDLTTPRPARVDVPSVGLSVVAFGGIVLGLSRVGESVGGDPVPAVVALAAGLAALAVFVVRQRRLQRHDGALLDLRTFGSSTFTVAVVVMALSMVGLFGTIILLPLYAQSVLGLEALEVGLLLLPGGLLMGLLAPSVGRAYDRFGPRVLLVPGTVVVSAALWGFVALGPGSPSWVLAGIYLVLGGGLALIFTPLFTAALGSLPASLYSHGSAMVGTVQQVAGAAGTALFITVLTVRSTAAAAAGADPVAAMADGVHGAFLVGAAISVLAVPAALAVRVRPGDGTQDGTPDGTQDGAEARTEADGLADTEAVPGSH
jgi:DHA2 family lincomycin resistance protein-like MFS transporter